jgi:hypothetical protein
MTHAQTSSGMVVRRRKLRSGTRIVLYLAAGSTIISGGWVAVDWVLHGSGARVPLMPGVWPEAFVAFSLAIGCAILLLLGWADGHFSRSAQGDDQHHQPAQTSDNAGIPYHVVGPSERVLRLLQAARVGQPVRGVRLLPDGRLATSFGCIAKVIGCSKSTAYAAVRELDAARRIDVLSFTTGTIVSVLGETDNEQAGD